MGRVTTGILLFSPGVLLSDGWGIHLALPLTTESGLLRCIVQIQLRHVPTPVQVRMRCRLRANDHWGVRRGAVEGGEEVTEHPKATETNWSQFLRLNNFSPSSSPSENRKYKVGKLLEIDRHTKHTRPSSAKKRERREISSRKLCPMKIDSDGRHSTGEWQWREIVAFVALGRTDEQTTINWLELLVVKIA